LDCHQWSTTRPPSRWWRIALAWSLFGGGIWRVPIWPGQRNPSDPSNAVRDPTTPTRTAPGGSHDTPNPRAAFIPLYDLDRDALETYLPDLHERADFDAFWADTLT
jgi:hypothetical protein